MSIERKYKKLGETALQLIRMDTILMDSIRSHDNAGEQAALTARSPLIYKIQTLVEWKPERKNEQFE